MWQAATRLQAEPPAAGEASGDYLARLALASPGILVILDHLEDLLADGSEADGSRWTSLVNLVGSAAARARERLRFVLCTTTATFPRLDRFARDAGLAVVPGRWLELPPLDGPRVAEIFEQTALQTGTFFDAGLAQVIATDLCRRGPVSPLELQVLARVVAEKRLTSLRRYERSGGSDILIHQFFRDITEEAGGAVARRLLLSLTGGEAMRAEEIAARVGLSRVRVESIWPPSPSQGLVRKHDGAASGNYSLIHPGLVPLIDGFAATDRSESRGARRLLRQRVLAGGRLSVGDLRRVRKHLSRGELSAEESLTIGRSRRRTALHLAVALLVGGSILVGLYARMRSSYTLDQMPPQDPASARIVVRLGRPSLSLWHLLPNRPPFGSILADTGFSAAAMASDLSHRIVNGTAVGALDRDRHVPVPGWLRTVLDGLRPVPRGLALVLMGDSSGVLSLKQAFADPPSRGEVLEALAVVGRGQAGEDEILGAALSDSSPRSGAAGGSGRRHRSPAATRNSWRHPAHRPGGSGIRGEGSGAAGDADTGPR